MNNSILLSIGIVGSVASVIGLLIASPGSKSKLTLLGYALFITILATVTYYSQQQLGEIRRAESQAEAIIRTADRSTSGSMAGFMLASLSFLEKYKQRFPDTYRRAVKLCDAAACAEGGGTSSQDIAQFARLQDASAAMLGLMRGIALGSIRD